MRQAGHTGLEDGHSCPSGFGIEKRTGKSAHPPTLFLDTFLHRASMMSFLTHHGCLRYFAAVVVGVSAAGVVAAEGRVSFNRDIRSILSDNCFSCHGPDERKRQAGLRLDLKAAAIQPVE